MSCNDDNTYSVGDTAKISLLLNAKDTELETIQSVSVFIYSDAGMSKLITEIQAERKGWGSNAYISVPSDIYDNVGSYYIKVRITTSDGIKTLNITNNKLTYK